MSRVRSLNPGFFLDDELAELDPLARILFAGLWCVADRNGRLKDRPRRIKSETLPYDDVDVDKLLDELSTGGFIFRYSVDNFRYIAIPSWKRYQNPHHKEAEGIIPEPTGQAWSKLESCKGQAWSKLARSSSSSSSSSSSKDASSKHEDRTCWRCDKPISDDDVMDAKCVLSRKGLRHAVCAP